VKSIGVCNFQVHHLQRLIDETGVAPVINQIELHPLMQQRQLHAWNATHKIQTESWSPLAQGGEGFSIRKLSATWRINIRRKIRWHLDNKSQELRRLGWTKRAGGGERSRFNARGGCA
jgi:2,5-diketo-D-gluconate reductase A